MRRAAGRFLTVVFLSSMFPVFAGAADSAGGVRDFDPPIDGLSVTISGNQTVEVRGFEGNDWGPWQALNVENEQDPSLRESNLVMFKTRIRSVEFRGGEPQAIHPIRVSDAPARYEVASLDASVPDHHILTRQEWGADESLRLYRTEPSSSSSSSSSETDRGEAPVTDSARVKECNQAYANYPEEFKKSGVIHKTYNGQTLLWPEEYSKQIRMIVVHHTAGRQEGETRSGLEMMRALYQYHAVNRGWGDIGYHYMIDPQGQIYEGRAGGDYVIGGHAYCNNVGTIGIALMGNFEIEQPTPAQALSLQWLMKTLTDKYQINMNQETVFHGKHLPPIVGHRDLLSTDCPGYTLWSVLNQFRSHVRENKITLAIAFPAPLETAPPLANKPYPQTLPDDPEELKTVIVTASDGLAPLGDTALNVRPGSEVVIPVYFRAPRDISKNSRIARVVRTIGVDVSQEMEDKYVSVRGDLRAPQKVTKGQAIMVRVKVKVPLERGEMALRIGSIAYALESSGKTIRDRAASSVPTTWTRPADNPALATRPTQRVTVSTRAFSSSTSSLSPYFPTADSSVIRVRLTAELAGSPALSAQNGILVTDARGSSVNENRVSLTVQNGRCAALGATTTADSVLRLSAADGNVRVENAFTVPREYHGVIECQVINGSLTLINELPLEDYMAGIAEEPDTEPYEKQRAFAVAARTYARYYMDPANRKFPGKPYDGSDSPAEFQLYRGALNESQNPQWVRAVRSTANNVLTYQGQIIKPPYFSSDDGRTKSPAQAGWNNFPFAQIFSAKDDPWCAGKPLSGHGVGMSGCGAEGQAEQGKTAEQILSYYYPGTSIEGRN